MFIKITTLLNISISNQISILTKFRLLTKFRFLTKSNFELVYPPIAYSTDFYSEIGWALGKISLSVLFIEIVIHGLVNLSIIPTRVRFLSSYWLKLSLGEINSRSPGLVWGGQWPYIDRNFADWHSKIEIFCQKWKILSKIEISFQIKNFVKNGKSNFSCQNNIFCSEIIILFKNRNFVYRSNFWSKIKIALKNR